MKTFLHICSVCSSNENNNLLLDLFVVVGTLHSVQNCRQKEAVLHPENNQIIYLTEREGWTGCGAPVDGMVHCETAQSFESARERWWFVAVSRCETIQVQIQQTMCLRFIYFLFYGTTEIRFASMKLR